MKSVLILRSKSGAGKSTLAEVLGSLDENTAICCADDYFTKDGVYSFNADKLWNAHLYCRQVFREAVDKEVKLVVVANTNTTQREFRFYEDYAKEKGYKIFHLVVENRHGNGNVHNVPDEALARQEKNLRHNISL